MNPLRISLRSLVYYRRTNAAILLACAAASAVMIGSLLVGSSVRKTLTERAAERFGHADYVIAAHAHFFREALADDIKGVHDGSGLYAPAVYLKGSAEDPDGSIAVPDVNVVGITRDFPRMYHSREFGNLSGRGAVINRSLADDFGVKQGSSLIITVPRYSAVSRDSLFGRKDRENILTLMRCTVSAVVPDTGPGLFSLSHDELQPRTIFLSLDWLQQRIGKPEQVNCILADTQRNHAALKRVLNRTAEPEDLGFRLKLNRKHGYISLETAGFTFTGDAAEAAHKAGRAAGFAVSDTSVYLFNRIGKGNRTVPYSTVAALEPHKPSAFPGLPVIRGRSGFRGTDDIILNEWAADDLEADIGDTLTAEYYTPAGGKSKLETGTGTFTVIGIAALQGTAGDPQLVPDFEGITDADSINEWKAPFDIDMSMIRGKDEDYWNRYRVTPKAFISSDAARSLWRGSGDDAWITSVRYMRPEHADPEQASAALRKEFRAHFGPDRGGIYTFDVKERAQQAGRGSADYGMLFMSMSMFIIVSVLGLIWQTFRLLCEKRMKQNGILLATGSSQRTVAGILLAEGAVTAAAGTCMGIPLAIVYTDMMLNGIKT